MASAWSAPLDPFLVLLGGPVAEEPGHGVAVGEAPDDVGAAADLAVEALRWGDGPEIWRQMSLWKVAERLSGRHRLRAGGEVRPNQTVEAIAPGQSWAYRARQIDDLVEVEVIRLGTQRPARVLIRFVDASFEGREEWVPPARLKVHWGKVEEYRARELRWERVEQSDLDQDDPRLDAANQVFELLIDEKLAWVGYRETAVSIADPAGLAELIGLSEDALAQHPDSFVEDGVLIAPWETIEQIARAALARNPEPVLHYLSLIHI